MTIEKTIGTLTALRELAEENMKENEYEVRYIAVTREDVKALKQAAAALEGMRILTTFFTVEAKP